MIGRLRPTLGARGMGCTEREEPLLLLRAVQNGARQQTQRILRGRGFGSTVLLREGRQAGRAIPLTCTGPAIVPWPLPHTAVSISSSSAAKTHPHRIGREPHWAAWPGGVWGCCTHTFPFPAWQGTAGVHPELPAAGREKPNPGCGA